MKCPYCDRNMQDGIISGDGRSGVYWKSGDKKADLWDKLGGTGKIEAAEHSLAAFTIKACYCVSCHKMIFDTEIGK